jgi:diadenosine tetraphosphate (Ap4A) HIT family hydrolase
MQEEDKKIFFFFFFFSHSLVCGDVPPSHIGSLFARVATLCKSQSFDMLLITGQLVSEDCSPDFVSEAHLKPYLSGVSSVPVMTYFCHATLEPSLVCDNLVCVGSAGLLSLSGLRVGFLSGLSGAAEVVLQQARTEKVAATGIDVLVSRWWPRNIMSRLPATEVPADTLQQVTAQASGSEADVTRACTALAPRYVFVPSPGQFIERRPFFLPGHRHVCRFLALAPVGNADKQKWLFAFKLRSGEVVATPEGTSPNPLEEVVVQAKQQVERRRPREDEEAGFQRWGALPAVEEGGDNKRRNKGPKLQRNADRGAECWFCLDSSNAEQHLVASVGNETYLALAKGAIVGGHMLVLPLEHVPSFVYASPVVCQEMERYMRALRGAAKKRGELVMFYERNVAHAYENPHCHIQALPLKAEVGVVEKLAKLLGEWHTWSIGPDGALPVERMRRELKGFFLLLL